MAVQEKLEATLLGPLRAAGIAMRRLLLTAVVALGLLAAPASANHGALDTGFSFDGRQALRFAGASLDSLSAVDHYRTPTDGRFLVAGTSQLPNPSDGGLDAGVLMARYRADGELDSSYNGGGKFRDGWLDRLPAGSRGVGAADMFTIGVSPRIVGTSWSLAGGYRGFMARYTDGGLREPGFGTGGAFQDDVNPVTFDAATRIGGGVLAGGSWFVGIGTMYLKSSETGCVNHALANHVSFSGDRAVNDLATDSAGRAVAVGYDTPGGTGRRWAVARTSVGGCGLDSGFSGDGVKTVDLTRSTSETLKAVAIQPDGRIVVAGSAQIPTAANQSNQALVVGRLLSDGRVDTSFDGDGVNIVDLDPAATDSADAVAIAPDGDILVAGVGKPAQDMLLVRFNSDGSLDNQFGGTGGGALNGPGYVTTSFGGPGLTETAHDLLIQAGGNVIAVGGMFGNGISFGILARYHGVTDAKRPAVKVRQTGTRRVAVEVDEPSEVRVVARRNGPVLAQATARARRAGRVTATLALTTAGRNALTERGQVNVTLVAVARDAKGNKGVGRAQGRLRRR